MKGFQHRSLLGSREGGKFRSAFLDLRCGCRLRSGGHYAVPSEGIVIQTTFLSGSIVNVGPVEVSVTFPHPQWSIGRSSRHIRRESNSPINNSSSSCLKKR